MNKNDHTTDADTSSRDVLTPEQRRRCMQSNKGRNTKPELAMGRLLWSGGIRYRKHPKDIPGTPDFCIRKYRLAIFVDGEFWHGKDWEEKKTRLKGNRDFWVAKIERNIARDRRVDAELKRRGWTVLRFWESEIKRSAGMCLRRVLDHISCCNNESAPEYIPSDICEAERYASLENAWPVAVAAEEETAYDSD